MDGVPSSKVSTVTIEGVWPLPPALVISDMWMPGACGGDAITRLKKRFPRVQLIAISGHFNSGQGFSAEAALKAGAERALAKPVERRELMRAVAELLGPADR